MWKVDARAAVAKDWIAVEPGLLALSGFYIDAETDDVSEAEHGQKLELRIVWDAEKVAYVVRELKIIASPVWITSESIRDIPVQKLIHDGVLRLQAVIAEGQDKPRHVGSTYPGDSPPPTLANVFSLDDADIQAIKDARGVESTLIWVARIYRLAQIVAEPPAKAVQTTLDVPSTTANYWIRLSKERGFLKP